MDYLRFYDGVDYKFNVSLYNSMLQMRLNGHEKFRRSRFRCFRLRLLHPLNYKPLN